MYFLRIYFKSVDSVSALQFASLEDRDQFFKSLGSAMRSQDDEPFCWNDGLIITDQIRMIEKV